MKSKNVLRWSLPTLLVCSIAFCVRLGADDAVNLLRRVVGQRLSIEEGTFRWQSIHHSGKVKKLLVEERYWLKGGKLKAQMTNGKVSRIRGFGCYGNDYAFFMKNLENPTQDQAFVEIKNGVEVSRFDGAHAQTDPRMLGLLPSMSFLQASKYRARTFFKPVGSVKESQARFQGSECRRLAFENHRGYEIELWIVPSMNDGVVRVSLKSGDHQDVVESNLTQIGASNFWFPSKCSYQRLFKGKLTNYHSQLTVNHVSFDRVPETEFAINRFDGLNPGTRVIWSASGEPPVSRPLYWDGNRIATIPASVLDNNRSDQFRNNSNTKLILGFVFLLISLVFIWKICYAKAI